MRTLQFQAWMKAYRRLEILRTKLYDPRLQPELRAQFATTYQQADELYLLASPGIKAVTDRTAAIFSRDPIRYRDAEFAVLDTMADLLTDKMRVLSQSQLERFLTRTPKERLIQGVVIPPQEEYASLLAILLQSKALSPFTVEMKNLLTRESLISVNPIYRIATPSDSGHIALEEDGVPKQAVICGVVVRLTSGQEVLVSGRRYDTPRHFHWALLPGESTTDREDEKAYFQEGTYNLLP